MTALSASAVAMATNIYNKPGTRVEETRAYHDIPASQPACAPTSITTRSAPESEINSLITVGRVVVFSNRCSPLAVS